ncbi:hypothetical protein [Nonomuraea longicatena]|uniref:Lipoprotein n=1 Tax=Nonomuraea longicatena TaxID=83682 RepID=A0ABN1P8R1_9ACTN
MKRALAALSLFLALAACASAAPQPPPAALTVSLTQGRSDQPKQILTVLVTNAGTAPVWIADVRLDSPSFAATGVARMDTYVKKAPVGLRIPYGAARCAASGVPEMAPARVVAHIRAADGPQREVSWALPHPDPLLARLFREECEAYVVGQAAEVVFGTEWVKKGRALHGSVVVTRRSGDQRISIADLYGNVHHRLEARPAVLEPGARRLEIPVKVSPDRCDPHSFAEAKIAMLFNARVALGGAPPRHLVFRSDRVRTQQGRLDEVLLEHARRTCGI